MLEAVARGKHGVLLDVGAIHRLQEEVVEVEPLEVFLTDPRLRIDELHLVARALPYHRARFGAHADPVESSGCCECAVRFDSDFEAEAVERGDQRSIELEQGLTAGDDYEALGRSDQRLQPANLRNTAGRPVLAPSPWRV